MLVSDGSTVNVPDAAATSCSSSSFVFDSFGFRRGFHEYAHGVYWAEGCSQLHRVPWTWMVKER